MSSKIHLLLAGLDLHIPDKSGNTAFATAMTSKNNKAAQKILQLEPQAAEQFDPRGRNFLHTAIIKGVNNHIVERFHEEIYFLLMFISISSGL